MKQLIIKNKDTINKKHVNKHPKYEYNKQHVVTKDDDYQMAVAIYEIYPHKSNYPLHYHHNNTEVFYVIKGSGYLITLTEKHLINEGDVIVCPPNLEGTHQITNHTDEMLVILDVDTNNYPDIIDYPNSDKVGIIKKGEKGSFYKNQTKVDYYEGE